MLSDIPRTGLVLELITIFPHTSYNIKLKFDNFHGSNDETYTENDSIDLIL